MVEIRYWDSCVFLGLFNKEQDKVAKCEGAIEKAEADELIIVASAITLAEVVWIKGKPKLSEESHKEIEDFFKKRYIKVRPLDRVIGDKARGLIWKHNLRAYDSIHLATALSVKGVVNLDTFDPDLMKLNGFGGLKIGHPDIAYQEKLDLNNAIEEPPDEE